MNYKVFTVLAERHSLTCDLKNHDRCYSVVNNQVIFFTRQKTVR